MFSSKKKNIYKYFCSIKIGNSHIFIIIICTVQKLYYFIYDFMNINDNGILPQKKKRNPIGFAHVNI